MMSMGFALRFGPSFDNLQANCQGSQATIPTFTMPMSGSPKRSFSCTFTLRTLPLACSVSSR